MNVRIWGCRGSIPSPGPNKIRYGGNTSCVQVSHEGTCIVLDGGSGIQRLGENIDQDLDELHVLLTHLHIDHTMGLGFFLPLYDPKVKVHLWGPKATSESLTSRLRRYFSPPLFPVRLNELPIHPEIHEISHSEFEIGPFKINTEIICHPSPTLGYRIEAGGKVLTYMPDHEVALGSVDFPNRPEWTSGFNLAKDADLLLHDGQYTLTGYQTKVGWGHSAITHAVDFARMCNVKKLAIFHHDPNHTDDQLDRHFDQVQSQNEGSLSLEMCKEDRIYIL